MGKTDVREVVSRISVSVSPLLLRRFDEALRRLGYTDRSKAVQNAMQSFVTESKWLCSKEGRGVGAIMLVYDSSVRQVVEKIIDTQQNYRSIAESSINLRVDETNCLQIIPVRGGAAQAKSLAEGLMTIGGVREVKLAIVTP